MIRVLLADDHQIMREGLVLALGNYPDIAIVGEAQNGKDALAQVALLHPDVLLLDVFMPVLDGITVARRMRVEHPDVRVVVLTMDTDATDIQQLVDARVAGLVTKDAHSRAVIKAIHDAMRDEAAPPWSLIPPALARSPVAGARTDTARVTFDLSARERQILCQLTQGMSNKEIARFFGISEKTVRNHLHHIFRKMAVADRTQAVILSLRYDLCVPSLPDAQPADAMGKEDQ